MISPQSSVARSITELHMQTNIREIAQHGVYIIIDRVIAGVKYQTMTTGDSVTLSSLSRDS